MVDLWPSQHIGSRPSTAGLDYAWERILHITKWSIPRPPSSSATVLGWRRSTLWCQSLLWQSTWNMGWRWICLNVTRKSFKNISKVNNSRKSNQGLFMVFFLLFLKNWNVDEYELKSVLGLVEFGCSWNEPNCKLWHGKWEIIRSIMYRIVLWFLSYAWYAIFNIFLSFCLKI